MGRVSETCGARFPSFVPSEAPKDRLDRHIGNTVGVAQRADLKALTLGMKPTKWNNRLAWQIVNIVLCLRAEDAELPAHPHRQRWDRCKCAGSKRMLPVNYEHR